MQINLNKSLEATESTLELAISKKTDIIAVQKPWLVLQENKTYLNTRSVNYSAFTQILPSLKNNT